MAKTPSRMSPRGSGAGDSSAGCGRDPLQGPHQRCPDIASCHACSALHPPQRRRMSRSASHTAAASSMSPSGSSPSHQAAADKDDRRASDRASSVVSGSRRYISMACSTRSHRPGRADAARVACRRRGSTGRPAACPSGPRALSSAWVTSRSESTRCAPTFQTASMACEVHLAQGGSGRLDVDRRLEVEDPQPLVGLLVGRSGLPRRAPPGPAR